MASDPESSRSGPFDLVIFLWQYRKLIGGVTLLATVAGLVASFIIREQYKSEVILYPAISNSASRSLLNEQSGSRDDILALGDEEDAQQLLQMLQSDEIRDRTAEKFGLLEHYRIKANGAHPQTELREAYEDHVTFEYTKFGSVRVKVLDEDRERAADIANFIASEVDSVWKGMQNERASIGVNLVEEKYREAERNVAVFNDSLAKIRSLGVQDYHTQSERFNEYLGAAIVKGDQRAINVFEEKFKVLAQYGGAYLTLQGQLDNELWRLNQLRTKLAQARADMESELPHKFIVNKALVADKKSYPVRWLLTLMCAISGFLLSLLLVVVQENLRKSVLPMPERFTFERFLLVFKDRWRLFVVVGLMAGALSFIFSGPNFITPRYRSSAIVYPVNLTSYSIETRADQLLQLLESNSIRDSVIERYDLMHHYRLDTALKGGHFALYNEYKDRVEISKTRYESVQIEVTDEDPKLARNMVTMILDQANLLARRLQREKSAEVLHIAERALGHAKTKLDSVETRLAALRNSSGLLAYESQAKELTKAYAKLMTSGASQGQKDAVRAMMREMEDKGGEFRSLTNLSDIFRDEYSHILTDYEHAVNDMTKELTYTNTIVYPEVPDKKIYPVRWLILLISVTSALFLCFLFVLMKESTTSKARAAR